MSLHSPMRQLVSGISSGVGFLSITLLDNLTRTKYGDLFLFTAGCFSTEPQLVTLTILLMLLKWPLGMVEIWPRRTTKSANCPSLLVLLVRPKPSLEEEAYVYGRNRPLYRSLSIRDSFYLPNLELRRHSDDGMYLVSMAILML